MYFQSFSIGASKTPSSRMRTIEGTPGCPWVDALDNSAARARESKRPDVDVPSEENPWRGARLSHPEGRRIPHDLRDRARLVVRPRELVRELPPHPARHQGVPERLHGRPPRPEEPEESRGHPERERRDVHREREGDAEALRHRPPPRFSSA